MAVNTWDGAVNSDFGNPGNWNTTGLTDRNPTADDDVIIPNVSNDPVVDTNYTINSLVIQSGGNLDGDGNTLTIDGENAAGYAVEFQAGSIITGTDTDITLTGSHGTDIDLVAGTGAIRNLTINKSGDEARLNGATTISGDVTVTAGQLSGQTADHSFGSLTIASGGTYSATSGTTTLTKAAGSGEWTFDAPADGSTVAHNGGTIKFDCSSGDQKFRNESGEGLNDIVIELDDGDFVHGSNVYCVDLSITLATDHTMRPNSAGHILVCSGDVTIVEGKLGATTNYTGNHSFGSLTIESGGEYIATSGTTTLTNNTASGTRSVYNNGGTFTHNNGTIKIDTSSGTNYDFDGDDLYNFTVECEDTNGAVQCDGQASTAVTVLNNLDIVMGILRTNGNTFTVHGNVYVRATSKTNKNKFVGQGVTQNVYGLITVEDGAFYDLANQGSGSYGTLNAGGIRIL